MLKGFMMAELVLLLAMVGIYPQSSIQRLTFGQLYLWEGISVVPVVVGLFGGAEVLQLMMTKHSIARRGDDARLAGVMQGVRDTFDHWWLTLRASAIGLGIGVIPGMGGAVSQFIAYAHAQHTSSRPETFGKGNVEGVLAAGAVNNSREGGNLIPTVAFGIPGSVSMAILLSVFLLKGLVPGPAMLTRNLDVTYAMVWVIVLSNIIAVGVSFLFLNQLVRLTFVKATLLVPFLLVLTAFGAYTTHNSLNDIVLMLAATVVGIAAIRWDWPRAPLLLALVLGDIAERYLFLSYSLYEWSWVTRPLVIAFALITAGGLVWPLVRGRARDAAAFADRDPSTRAGSPRATSRGEGPCRNSARADVPITIGFLMLGVAVLLQARGWPFRTAIFPLATTAILVGLSLMKLAAAARTFTVRETDRDAYAGRVPRGEATERPSGPGEMDDVPDIFATATRREWLSAIGWMATFFLVFWLLGALIAVPLFAVVYLLAVSRSSPAVAGVYALASWVFVYGLFGRLLRLPLP
jgi:hypothetical protein